MCTGDEITLKELDDMIAEELKNKPKEIVIRGSEKFIKEFDRVLEEHSKKYIIGCNPYEK